MGKAFGFAVDTGASEPLYKQLFDQIVERIVSHTYPPGHRLPPTRVLADELGTHRNTVVRVYEELEAAGYVESTVGRGTFVRKRETPDAVQTPTPNGIAWSSLIASHAKATESLRRYERLSRISQARDAVNLARMQPSPDLLPTDALRRCADYVLRSQGPRALGYAPQGGLPRLRELIAQDLVRQGVPAHPDDVLITTGSQQAIDLVARALVNPGDTFLVDSTTYTGAIHLLGVAGARLVPVPQDGEGPDLSALARLGRSGAKGLYLMPNCHNPTGRTISPERREALVAWSQACGVPILEDDYGADLGLEEGAPVPAMRALDGDVIYSGTFSKKLSPALRVGFLLCPPGLKPVLFAMKHTMDLGTSVFLQHVLAEFLERGWMKSHLQTIRPEYRKRRDALVRALGGLPKSVRFEEPKNGVALWLTLPDGVRGDDVYEEAMKRGVVVTPGSLNSVEGDAPGVRITFCAEKVERVAEGGKRIVAAVKTVLEASRGRERASIEMV